jgi:hypothetical protein
VPARQSGSLSVAVEFDSGPLAGRLEKKLEVTVKAAAR